MLHRLQNRIPLIISILGYIYILSPILYYVYYAMLFGHPAVRYARTVQRKGTARLRILEALQG